MQSKKNIRLNNRLIKKRKQYILHVAPFLYLFNFSISASGFHPAMHTVSIYPFSTAISDDWHEEASGRISTAIGVEPVFLQGNAGDMLGAFARSADQLKTKFKPAKLNGI